MPCAVKNTFIKYLIFFLLFNAQLNAQDALKDFAAFPFGAAVSANLLKNNSAYRALVTKEFSSITAENAMKFGTLHPSQNTYFWTDGDTIVNFAQLYNKRIHGHTLIWHNSLPTWVTNYVGDAAAWETLFRTHIETVVTHYSGKLASWDVVNEAFNDDGTLRNSIWLQKLGTDYIARAFQYAHAADPSALLFYNDYGHEYSTAKLTAIKNLANSLVAAGVPIHGLGLQLHVNKNTSNNNMSNAIDMMLSTGLKVHIAEFDVAVNPENNQSLTYDATIASQLFGKYKFISRYAKKIAAGQFHGITTWNVTDADSWIPSNYSRPDFPLPFSSSYQRKTAYQGIKDAIISSWEHNTAYGQSLAGTYTDLGTMGTAITTGFTGNAMGTDNDNSSVQNIGFNFNFNGTTYTQFVLNTNGYIKLGANAPTANNIFYPTASGNTGGVITTSDIDLIYPFNHDLKSGTSTAEYRVAVSGNTGSRVCTIQFKNVADGIAPVQYANMEFQIKLHESSNNIEFIYGTWVASANASTLMTAAIGIKGIESEESVNVVKASSTAWNAALSTNYYFKADDYAAAGPLFNNRNGFLPDVGRTFRFSTTAPLPLTLLNFSVQPKGANAQLDWQTADEIGSKSFDIERAFDGVTFDKIGEVAAKSGKHLTTNTYTFIDKNNKNTLVYYRLKMIDNDGSFKFSKIVSVYFADNSTDKNILIVPNPVLDNQLNVFHHKVNTPSVIKIFSMQGILIQTNKVLEGTVQTSLNLDNLPKGNYVAVFENRGFRQMIKWTKQ